MRITIYQVDAFTNKLFAGNPAAVCPLDEWLSDALMQNIAMENNLAETAFFVRKESQYELRWFTPVTEVDLCGHATLASAYVLFEHEHYTDEVIRFHSPRSGPLTVKKNEGMLTLNFPADKITPIPLSDALCSGFSTRPTAAYKGKTDYLLVFDDEETIRNLVPVFDIIAAWPVRGVIVTAKGSSTDFISRFFGPQVGVPEDPVTGSAHTTLMPYWSSQLGRKTLTGHQLSKRGGYLECTLLDDRVEISGQCRLYMTGVIHMD